jgi:DNA-binding transcriptional LysR family regulator
MELKQLRALVALADTHSFTAAADVLRTVQSNVSTHVSRLERELHTTLYDRATGKLTPAGELVVTRARRVIAEMEAIKTDVAAVIEEVSGLARVGMIGTTARWLAPALLEDIAQRYPRVQLVIVEGTTTVLEPLLSSDQLDLALLHLPVNEREITAVPLFEEELVLVVSKDDPLAKKNRIDITQLDKRPLLLPMSGTAFRHEIDSACEPLGIQLSPKAEIDGIRLIASLTFEGYGPAILPATAIPRYLRDQWKMVSVQGLPPRRIGIARRTRGLLSAPARAVTEALLERLSNPDVLPERVRPAARDEDHATSTKG